MKTTEIPKRNARLPPDSRSSRDSPSRSVRTPGGSFARAIASRSSSALPSVTPGTRFAVICAERTRLKWFSSLGATVSRAVTTRSEERRVGKEGRSRGGGQRGKEEERGGE